MHYVTLRKAEFWLADGSFKISPKDVYQIYTLMGSCGAGPNQRILPFAIILMTGKSQIEYSAAFDTLDKMSLRYAPISEEWSLRPNLVIVDFEQAAANAFQIAWPAVKIRHCYFHLSQSVVKRTRSLFASGFAFNQDFHTHIRSLYCLSFFAPEKIEHAYNVLKNKMTEKFGDQFPNLNKLWTYFEMNYIGNDARFTHQCLGIRVLYNDILGNSFLGK